MNKSMLETRKRMLIEKLEDEDYLIPSYEKQRRKRYEH